MSTRLQRLIDRARSTQQGADLRIEPLLGPRFAKPGEASRTLEEIDLGAGASAHMAAASSPFAQHGGPRPKSTDHPEPHREAGLPHATSLAKDTLTVAPQSRAAPRTERALQQPAQTLLARGVREPVQEQAPHADMAQASAYAPPVRTPPSPISPSRVTAPAKVQRDVPAPTDATPTITISIGHVEVRNALPPGQGAMRRPAFRPGVSLDAFLQRGKGDGR